MKYRKSLPQLQDDLFLTEGGIETTLIFDHGQDLPYFATFPLLKSRQGRELLINYYRPFLALARRFDAGLILETPTWRANREWGARLGYDEVALGEANRDSVRLLQEICRSSEAAAARPIVLSGGIGPRGDGYRPEQCMSENDAQDYHRSQVETFAGTACDLVTALTMNHAEEAIGIVRAARESGLPVVISFTLETDGNLPTGQPLGEAIEQVDGATSAYPAYYMINCAHPSHFAGAVSLPSEWKMRIRGLRANASRMSHTELDEATELDSGDPVELARQYADLKRSQLPFLNVLGGCCGTDQRHVEQIARSCRGLFQ